MKKPKVVSSEKRLAARKKLLAEEKAFTRARDRLSKARRDLPCEAVTKEYVFEAAREGIRIVAPPEVERALERPFLGTHEAAAHDLIL